jgi:hypothetical protein
MRIPKNGRETGNLGNGWDFAEEIAKQISITTLIVLNYGIYLSYLRRRSQEEWLPGW